MVLPCLLVLLSSLALGVGKGSGRPGSTETGGGDSWDRDRSRDFDPFYGAFGGRDRDFYGLSGGYRDHFPTYRDHAERKEEDDCHRVEANGVPLADALQEAVAPVFEGDRHSPQLRRLLEFFTSAVHHRFLLAHCPQAVVLAMLVTLDSEGNVTGEGEEGVVTAGRVREVLAKLPTVRFPYRPAPQWKGQPWEPLLSAAQQRSGVVLFPIGEQQFHTEAVDVASWRLHPRQRCAGRRDLGNLQATPLNTCLAKCLSHPLCKSATFWHWQPGGYGFEQRCFLSSSCTATVAKADGAEGAVLFERRRSQSSREEAIVRRTIVTPGGAAWAPRCGHRTVATTSADGHVRLWLLGGSGVDSFAGNTSSEATPSAKGEGRRGLFPGRDAEDTVLPAGLGFGRSAQSPRGRTPRGSARSSGQPPSLKDRERNRTSSVVDAYLSRHVELNGELLPLRSLPYGRLADVWRSDDLGTTWRLVTSEAPFGRRAFFGAVTVLGGRVLLVLGGVRSPSGASTSAGAEHLKASERAALPREYLNDVWWGSLEEDRDLLRWQRMADAPWKARAGFQALSVIQDSTQGGSASNSQLLVLGGRMADGTLLNDVWLGFANGDGKPDIRWQQLTAAAPWVPRADFAAAAGSSGLWVLGGGDQAGRPLADVWWSSDGRNWQELVHRAPWGPRVGAAAVFLDPSADGTRSESETGRPTPGPLVLFGGFAYPDALHGPIAADEDRATEWQATSWISTDGAQWQLLNITRMSWAPNAMHATLVSAPCGGSSLASCAYSTGGLTHEGYYDNTVYRLFLSSAVRTSLHLAATAAAAAAAAATAASAGAAGDNLAQESLLGLGPHTTPVIISRTNAAFAGAALCVLLFCCQRCRSALRTVGNGLEPGHKQGVDGRDAPHHTRPSMDPHMRLFVLAITGVLLLLAAVVVHLLLALSRLSGDLELLRTERPPRCGSVSAAEAQELLRALGLQQLKEQWGLYGTLLRLALREPAAFGYGLGGYQDYWRGTGRAGDAYGAYGSRAGDSGYGLDAGFGYQSFLGGAAAGLGSREQGALSGLSGEGDPGVSPEEAVRERELSLLPTTQGLPCRSPRCDRNSSSCASGVARPLSSPYGCCNDYMFIMLQDVTDWLQEQRIPYFVTYGTLLGALRSGEILPHTQDMDIVVDRAYWVQLQRGLEAAEFFGGRRYLFGVDQWEERVSRVCADWEGFASSTIGGPEGDRLSRASEFHLDIYASDWWQITDLHLMDCLEPLGTTAVTINGKNFSSPARPRACVEKLYGADWRVPRHALAGVN